MDKQLRLKEKIKEQYGKIALNGNSESCCMPSSDCCSPIDIIYFSILLLQKQLDMILIN